MSRFFSFVFKILYMNKKNIEVMNELKVLCIHHTDLDGAGSAACVGLKHINDEVTYRIYNYGWPLEEKEFYGYDLIYAVDVSFNQSSPWVYQIPNLIWIDHHKTALEYEDQNPWMHQIPGKRAIGKGACELTWEYLFPNTQCPLLIQYLSTYDVWDKNRFNWEYIEEIEYGAKQIFGISPVSIIDFIQRGENPETLRETGRNILAYLEKSGRSKLKNNGFYIHDFFGYRVMALNTLDFSSMSFLSHYTPEHFDIMMPFAIVPDEKELGKVFVRFSLYTENPNVDVSIIAKKFSGGGHKGSAGFQTSLETLQEILKCSGPLKLYMESIGFKGNEPRRA